MSMQSKEQKRMAEELDRLVLFTLSCVTPRTFAQVVAQVRKTRPINHRTVERSIARLRKDGVVELVSGGWVARIADSWASRP